MATLEIIPIARDFNAGLGICGEAVCLEDSTGPKKEWKFQNVSK